MIPELELLHELRAARVLVWSKDNGQLGFSLSTELGFPDGLKERVRAAKTELLDILRHNGIDSAQRAADTAYYRIPEGRDERVLRSIQKGMYLQSRMDELGYTYTIPLFVELHTATADIAERAVRALLEAEPILRMRVHDDLGYQILPPGTVHIEHHEIAEDELDALREDRARLGFPDSGGLLLRPEIIALRGQSRVIVGLTHHHLMSDAYSMEVIAGRLASLYDTIAAGGTPQPRHEPTYLDYAAHQDVELRTPGYITARNALAERLAQAQKPQLGRAGTRGDDNRADTLGYRLDARTTRALAELATEHQLSLYAVLFTGLYHVLSSFQGGESGFAVAATVGNRPDTFESAIGPFINTLPVIPEYHAGESVVDNARRVHDAVLDLNQHHQLNLDMLTDAVPGGAADLADLVQVLFTMHNFRPAARSAQRDYRVLPYRDLAEKFGITLIAREDGDGLELTVTHAAARYEPGLVEALFDAYLVFLRALAQSPADTEIGRIALTGDTVARLVERENDTAVHYDGGQTAVEMFERQAERTPEAIAVRFRDRELTYRELNERANGLARLLVAEHGVSTGDLVCLLLDRGDQMLTAILAVLKAGGAYVPVDPELPPERIRFILADTATPVLLTEGHRTGEWRDAVPAVAVDDPRGWERQDTGNLGVPIIGADLAYAIYTSGTTGQPKGVLCEHRGLVNRIQWMNARYPLRESDAVLQKTPYVFDVSVWELLWANWFGATIVFAEPDGHKDPGYLARVIEDARVTVMHFVPSMLGAFLDALEAPGDPAPSALRGLRYLFCSGEELKLDQVRRVHDALPWTGLHNLYGPTEASIDALYFDCTDRDLEHVLIGRPIANMRAEVLGAARTPLPCFAIGELYLGGVGLARGYLNRPELTEERFVPDPFRPGERLYRTGDLVRRLPDGTIDYIGRNDFQVKIRGYRIELGEIEAALERHPDVRRGLTVVRSDPARPDNKSLLGYYVSDHPLDTDALRRELHAALPEYMVPAVLLHLTEIPLTVNGKLDRKALPVPEFPAPDGELVAPRHQRDTEIRQLCAEAVGMPPERLSIRHDLARLGMDSIVAIQLASRLRQRLGVAIGVHDIFARRTVAGIADLAADAGDGAEPAVHVDAEQGLLDGEVPLLPIQSWFFEQRFDRPEHWNQAFLLRTPELSVPRLEHALRMLIETHDAFRLRFEHGPDGVLQSYDPAAGFTGVNVLDVRSLPGAEGTGEFAAALYRTLTSWQRGFDLHDGPLHAFGYLHGFADGSARVFVAAHHLVLDAVSWRILAEDLRDRYENPGEAEVKTTSYRQWADAVTGYAVEHLDERDYWAQRLADLRTPAALTGDRPLATEEFALSEPDTRRLLGDGPRVLRGNTEELLLSTLGHALRTVTGEDVQHVLLEGHGREDIDPAIDVSRTVGWFTTLYPVRLELDDDLAENVCAVKETLRSVPARGLGFGALHGYRDLPAVWFNYLGQLDAGESDWRIVMADAGAVQPEGTPPAAALTFFAYVAEGRLRVRVDSRLDPAITRELAGAAERALAELVSRCARESYIRYTPSDFRDVRSEADLLALPPATGDDPSGWFEMTDIQQAYLVGRLGNYEIGNVANHVYNEFVYRELDTARLEDAINQLIAECDVLRTVFSFERLRQRVLPVDEVPRYRLTVREYEEFDDAVLAEVRDRLSHRLHDPERFPLFTFEVSRFPDRCVLHLGVDLIMLDVRSRLAVQRRLHDIYRGEDRRTPLPSATFKDYQDYLALLRHSRWYEDDREYWQGKLAEMPLRAALPFRSSPDTITHPRFGEHTIHIGHGVWGRFKDEAGRRGLSASSVLLSLFGSVLGYFSGTREFPITVTLFNRYPFLPDTDDILGNFTSTVLHHFADEPHDVERLTRRTHDELWEAVSHALYPGVRVQRDLSRMHGLDTTKAVSPIVFTGAVGAETRNFAESCYLEDDELVEQRYWNAQTSQAWIDLQAIETGDGFASKWLYVEQLFDRTDIEQLNGLFCALVERLARGAWQDGLPRQRYLPEPDRALIAAANDQHRPCTEHTLLSCYEDTADESAIAVIDGGTGREHTYGELIGQSDALARLLVARTTGEPLVGVLAEKGYLQVLGTSAIMKAGLGYLPLHVDWPVARIAGILEQAGVHTVLVSRAQAERPDMQELGASARLIVLEDAPADAPGDVTLPEVCPDDVAYVIFTSGSTGRPKGVTISHRGAVNTVLAVNERFDVGPEDRVLALSELSFDLSVYDIFGVLAAGGAVVFPDPGQTKNPAHWAELVARHRITVWNSVPQLAGLLVEEPAPGSLTSLRVVMMSGDWIPTTLPDRLRAACPDATVLSLGGATEGSIWSIWYEIGEVDPAWTSIPYGVAMPNQRMYVLNPSGEHCPVGVPGEIHIGGDGVALNYWGDADLTAQRYIEHPELGRLYRTGDLGSWSRDGYMEFLGRTDFQVKLNGYRVELGEVETALARHPRITQSVVVVHDRGGNQTVAGYYVAPEPLDSGQLRGFLGGSLPDYMVPDVLVHLTELPLSPNGKLDRNALPEPDAPDAPEHVPPRGPGETLLRELWAEVLGVDAERLGVRDDLLNLGVDSIGAIRMVSRLRSRLGVVLGVRDIFAHRTIESLHERVLGAEPGDAPAVRAEHGTLDGEVPLLPIQSWFAAQEFARPQHWNQAFLLRTPELSADRLQDALRALAGHHDALRLRYLMDGGVLRQYYDPAASSPPLRVLDVRELTVAEGSPGFDDALDEVLTEWQSGFTLGCGPVCAFGYLHGYADGSARVFIAAHHLVVDTVSWRVLAEDLRTAYEGGSLPGKTTSYRQWAQLLPGRFTAQRSYWDGVLDALPSSGLVRASQPREVELAFDAELTRALLRDCQRMYGTRVNEFLLTAFGHALSTLTGRLEHGIVLEGHGREDLATDVDITRTVGWFTTLFPCHLELGDDPLHSLAAVKDTLRAIPDNGIGYGSLLGYERPLPEVCFNYLGRVDDGAAGPWQITGERAGRTIHPDNMLPYTVNLAGMVAGERLSFRLYSRLSDADTDRLATAFRDILTELVHRTSTATRSYLTSSDIDGLLPQSHVDTLQRDTELADIFAATSLQQGFIAHALRQGEVDDAYRVQAVWDYRAAIDPELLRQAWEHAQRTHACLRTGFDWRHQPVQVVARKATLRWRFADLSGHPDPDGAFEELRRQDQGIAYDLSEPGLFRVYLVKRGESHYTCLLNTHHAILDGWSSPLLLDTVHSAYLRLCAGEPVAPVTENYAQCQRFLRRHAHQHDAFWREYVREAGDPCDLGGLLRPERRNTDLGTYQHVEQQSRRSLQLSTELLAELRGIAAAEGVTLNAVLQYAWHKQLATYGNRDTTVVGTVLSGRDLPVEGIEQAVGLFLSTVPLLARHSSDGDSDGDDTMLDEIRALQRDIHEINERSTVDLAALQPPGRRLFDSLFIYENYPAVANPEHERELAPEFRFRHQKRDYPLVVTVAEQHDGVAVSLDYAEELFDPATIDRLLGGIESILTRFRDEPALPAGRLVLADEHDLRRQETWNDTGVSVPPEPLIHRAFERWAARTPDAPALEHRGRVHSYAQLNGAANRLARLLCEDDVHGEPVLLLLDRDEQLVISLLAVLKAGAAYVPLDPGYPGKRIDRIVASSGARVVVTRQRHVERLRQAWPGLRVIAVDDPGVRERLDAQPADDPALPVDAAACAYILYTSGSTGEPKGVEVGHYACTSTVRAMLDRHFPDAGALCTYSMTNYVFDIFGLEYGLTLLAGGRMVLGEPWDGALDCTAFEFLQLTPSLLEMKLPELHGTERTRLLVGGEKLERHLLRAALPRFAEVVNVYGPTETTIWSTTRSYRDGLGETEPVCIGRALPGEGAHVLGAGLRPLPVGAIGELYLSGDALARGYAGDPELTARRFVDDGARRLYRTGDLARWLDTGELEFLGRIDNQVKLRGHRIELGEVESALSAFDGVRHSVARVVTPDSGAGRLVGYYVSGEELDERALAAHLADLLPEHMRPDTVLRLPEIPLTYSGKLDVAALPVPERDGAAGYVAPAGEIQAALARVWQEVLGLDRVGVHDRFFDLGGNSILLTTLHGRLPEWIRERLRVTDLFSYPTIASLSEHLGARPSEEERPEPARVDGDGDIAIIGMACRFPDADDVDEYWHNLLAGKESIVRYSRAELLDAGIAEEVLDQPGYVPAQSRIRSVGGFDAEFFGYSRREAEIMDPQHRVFLECAWHALEDAFCDPARQPASIGLYAGMGQNDYLESRVRPALGPDPSAEYQAMINNQANFLCTKVAYRLNLTGPAVTVQTACSASLVAVHQASVALRAGDCEVALAGGVSIGKLAKEGYLHQDGMVFSPDGTCRAFDADAAGTVEGQGAGIVVLKPLERAIEDGDAIRAVLKGSAINNDGNDKVGYTAPSPRRQAAVIRAAHRRGGIDPATVSYVETHGTGTPLGDPIELEGLREAFGRDTATSCALGAVKTNIGHLDVAAGVAGLIKAVLCLENRTLVPTLNYRAPNPAIDLGGQFHVNTERTPWTSEHGVLRAGVSSFGIGGTNAHVVLEQAPQPPEPGTPRRDRHLLVTSARTPEALRRQSGRLARYLGENPGVDIDRVAYTTMTARRRFGCTRVIAGADRDEVLAQLDAPDPEYVLGREGRPVVFLFPGQGAQYEGMGLALYHAEPVFASAVDECVRLLRPYLPDGAGEADVLGRNGKVGDTEFTQPALFILEYALAQWYRSLGVRPDAMIGHSIGEYVAACLAGVFSLSDALWLVHERGRLLAETEPGAMLAVPLRAEQLADYPDAADVDVAVLNDDSSCVVAGTPDAVDRLAGRLSGDGVHGRRVAVTRAFHSRLLDPVLARFEDAVARVELRKPDVPFVSNLTGDWADAGEVTQPQYWVAQLRNQVAFAPGLDTILESEATRDAVFVEVGPGRTLTRLVHRHQLRDGNPAVASMPPAAQAAREPVAVLAALGTVHASGAGIDAEAVYGLGAADRVRLPGYPFARDEYWIDGAPAAETPVVVAEPRRETSVADVVADAWQAVLGVGRPNPEDDFFAQGGDSLAAVQLVARVERGLGVRLEFMELDRHTPTALIHQLEARLGDHSRARVRSVIRVKQGDPAALAPLVLIHPVGGDVYFYRELAQCLPDQQPIFVIRSPMLDGIEDYQTIEQMATSYVDMLEELGVHPPYRLGGASFGGLVAYEMAQQVGERGGRWPEVVLIDSPAYGHLPESMDEAEILSYLGRYGLSTLDFSMAELESLGTVEEKIRYLAGKARGTVFEEMLAENFLPRYLSTWCRHNDAMHRYVPRPYPGDIVFFSHQEVIPEFPTAQHTHWRRLARGNWRHVPVPGNHLSMNAMPHVARIGAELNVDSRESATPQQRTDRG